MRTVRYIAVPRVRGVGATAPPAPTLSGGPVNWANVDWSLQGQILSQLMPGVIPFGVPNLVLYGLAAYLVYRTVR
jgi:hypothetical protein